MTKNFDTPKNQNYGIEDELGLSEKEAELLGAMIIEDEEQALFSDENDATADDDQSLDKHTTEDADQTEDPDGQEAEFADEDQLVMLPDGTEITVHELIRGNLRDADYRKKTMDLADQRRDVEQVRSQLEQNAIQTANERAFMAELLQKVMPKMPDPTLAKTNPKGFEKALAAYHAMQQGFTQLAKNHKAALEQSNHELEAHHADRLEKEFDAMLKDNPDFKDPAAFEAFQNDAVTHFQSYGFAPQEIESVADHRFIKVMRDALSYRQLQQAKPQAMEKVRNRPPVMGSKARMNKANQVSKAVKKRISQAKDVGDAQSVSDILGQLLEQK